MSHAISIADIRDHGTSFSLMQDGIKVAIAASVEEKKEKVSDDLTRKRWGALRKMDLLSEKVTQLWSTDETAAEAVANGRR